MRVIRAALAVCICLNAKSAVAESLYLTVPAPIPKEDGRFDLILTYFPEVKSRVSVSINPGTPAKDSSQLPGPPTVTISLTPVPAAPRAYLYATHDAFFSDALNVGVDNNGLLSNSDSSSSQQFTAILTELAQAAGSLFPPGAFIEFVPKGGEKPPAPPPPPREDDHTICYNVIKKLVTPGPYNRYYDIVKAPDATYPVYEDRPAAGDRVRIFLALEASDIGPIDKVSLINEATGEREAHPGFVAYYQYPVTVTLDCSVGGRKWKVLTAPQVLNLYVDSDFFDPQRDFFTNPQDTFTLNAGFVTSHKLTRQSAAKTVVDTVTQPIHALMPSVSVNTSTSVVQTGGKPSQVTTTTGSTVSPPKP